MKIAVFGANGPTGRQVLRLGAQAGHDLLAISRHPDELERSDGIAAVAGDVLDVAQTAEVLQGADAVLSCLGVPYSKHEVAIYSRGTASIAAGMRANGLSRIVAVSSSAVDPAAGPRGGPIFERFVQPYVAKMGRTLYQDMVRMEALLAASDLDWTVLRPSGLFDHDQVTEYRVGERYVSGAFTSRTDLAATMLAQLESAEFVRKVAAVCTDSVQPSIIGLIWREAIHKPSMQKRIDRNRAARVTPLVDPPAKSLP